MLESPSLCSLDFEPGSIDKNIFVPVMPIYRTREWEGLGCNFESGGVSKRQRHIVPQRQISIVIHLFSSQLMTNDFRDFWVFF